MRRAPGRGLRPLHFTRGRERTRDGGNSGKKERTFLGSRVSEEMATKSTKRHEKRKQRVQTAGVELHLSFFVLFVLFVAISFSFQGISACHLVARTRVAMVLGKRTTLQDLPAM